MEFNFLSDLPKDKQHLFHVEKLRLFGRVLVSLLEHPCSVTKPVAAFIYNFFSMVQNKPQMIDFQMLIKLQKRQNLSPVKFQRISDAS